MTKIVHIGLSPKNVKYVKLDGSIKNSECLRLVSTRHPDRFEFSIVGDYLKVRRIDQNGGWGCHHKCEVVQQIQDMRRINQVIQQEGLEVCVVSYGGSRSNTLVNALAENGLRCRTRVWGDILCHCPHHFRAPIPIIYVYDDPMKALQSMKRRGREFWNVNQMKLSNNRNVEFSDENLLRLMVQQFKSWTSRRDRNVLVVKSCELHEPPIVQRLETHLARKLSGFPIPFRASDPAPNDLDPRMLARYQRDIDLIRNHR